MRRGLSDFSPTHRVSYVPCPAQRVSMDPTVLRNVAATTVASVIGLLGSATVLLAISGIGECVALGSWGGPGGGGAPFTQMCIPGTQVP